MKKQNWLTWWCLALVVVAGATMSWAQGSNRPGSNPRRSAEVRNRGRTLVPPRETRPNPSVRLEGDAGVASADRPVDRSAERSREQPRVELEITSAEGEPWGRIVITLNPDRTPVTVRNFLRYVEEGFYDGTVFHRVLPGFLIQGGGHTGANEPKIDGLDEPIRNESRRAMRNKRGTISMARKKDPHTAQSQFYINLSDNLDLDYPAFGSYGYTVFGEVVEGMDVVDRIAAVPTRVSPAAQRRFDRYREVGREVTEAERSLPLRPPVIKSARRIESPGAAEEQPVHGRRPVPRRSDLPEVPPEFPPGHEPAPAPSVDPAEVPADEPPVEPEEPYEEPEEPIEPDEPVDPGD